LASVGDSFASKEHNSGMRKAVLIVPNWLVAEDGQSVLWSPLSALSFFAERSSLRKCISAMEPCMVEATWLGLAPGTVNLEDGPLIVSAFGYDPPDRSVQFQMSLMSLVDGAARKLMEKIPRQELDAIWQETQKLNTRALTAVRGEGTEHGLVWEDGSLEMGTTPAKRVEGNPIAGLLPEGDGERMLRRFVDDAINLLSELELNQIRLDEGREPLNLWWPWGQGFRTATPNLALRRGEVSQVESASIRLQGLVRLCGYRHGDRSSLRSGLRTNFEHVGASISKSSSSISVIGVIAELREQNRVEEMDWFTKELNRRLLEPLVQLARREPLHLTLLAPSTQGQGLVLDFRSDAPETNSIPFDERALEEKSLQTIADWQAVNEALIS
jgi:hypothetical protein